MKRSRFTEEQIVAIPREQEAGVATADLCRKHGVSSATFYKWKAKYGGLDVSDAKRLKALEDENAKLKRLLATALAARLAHPSCLCRHLRHRRASGINRPDSTHGRIKPGGNVIDHEISTWLVSSARVRSSTGLETCSLR